MPTSSDSYTQDNGKGEKLDARISVGAGGATIGLGFEGTKGGQTVSVQVTFQSCDFDAPSCPTSEGVLDGTEKLSATIKAVLREGDDVRYQDKTKVKIETKIRGQVADDAKLDYIDIDNSETQVKSSSGSAR